MNILCNYEYTKTTATAHIIINNISCGSLKYRKLYFKKIINSQNVLNLLNRSHVLHPDVNVACSY